MAKIFMKLKSEFMNIHVDMLYMFVICMYYMSLIVYKYLDTNVGILIISIYECTMFCHGKRSNGSAIETIYRYSFSKLNSSRSSLVYSLTIDVYYKITKHLINVGIYLSCKLSANDMEIKCKMIHNNNKVYTVIVYMVIVARHIFFCIAPLFVTT